MPLLSPVCQPRSNQRKYQRRNLNVSDHASSKCASGTFINIPYRRFRTIIYDKNFWQRSRHSISSLTHSTCWQLETSFVRPGLVMFCMVSSHKSPATLPTLRASRATVWIRHWASKILKLCPHPPRYVYN